MSVCLRDKKQIYLCEGFSLKRLPRSQATPNDTPVTSKKKMGMIHSSRNFSGKKGEQFARSMHEDCGGPGERKKATLEKSRQGVKKLTFMMFNCCE
jgi:hypothetical protein